MAMSVHSADCAWNSRRPRSARAVGWWMKRALCQQLFTELNNLALELRWQMRQGVTLEWSAMVSTSLPQRTDHALLLNSAGDTLLIALPLLHGTPGLLYVLLPWLAAEVGSGPPADITLDAVKLGWTTPASR